MTLTSAIEAARGFILESYASKGACGCHSLSLPSGGSKCLIHKALAALPDKPKSESEILKIISLAIYNSPDDGEAHHVLRALTKANVLFVKEVEMTDADDGSMATESKQISRLLDLLINAVRYSKNNYRFPCGPRTKEAHEDAEFRIRLYRSDIYELLMNNALKSQDKPAVVTAEDAQDAIYEHWDVRNCSDVQKDVLVRLAKKYPSGVIIKSPDNSEAAK